MTVELRLALAQDAEEHVSHLTLRRTRATTLCRVHPAVREAQSCTRIAGLLGQEDHPARAADREAIAVRTERRGSRSDRIADMMRAGRDDAELVSAQTVGGTVGRDRDLEAPGELSQQRVTGRMAEAVVVRLETVEVEEREDSWVGPRLGELREVLHELTAVGETGERIGAGLRPISYVQAPVRRGT